MMLTCPLSVDFLTAAGAVGPLVTNRDPMRSCRLLLIRVLWTHPAHVRENRAGANPGDESRAAPRPEYDEAPHRCSTGEGLLRVAEDRGFEPLRALTQPAFQASAIGH